MSGEQKIVVKAVVIGRRSSGEGSVRVILYTDALGLVTALSKSGREERSQLRAHLQAGTYGLFSLVKGRDTWRVAGVMDTKNAHFESEGNPEAQESLQRVLSLVRQFVRGEGEDAYFFETLWGFVEGLSASAGSLKDSERVAVLRLLSALGYVESSPNIAEFLKPGYSHAILKNAPGARASLTSAINEAITASGLG